MPTFNFRDKGKVDHIIKSLNSIRTGVDAKGIEEFGGKKDLSLSEYLAKKFPEGQLKNDPEKFDMQYLYGELGINPNVTTVSQLVELDTDSRWLVPEFFRDTIRLGIRTQPFYTSLTALSIDVPQPTTQMPFINMSEADAQETGEAETISTGSVSYGNKSVTVTKRAVGLKLTYESIRFTPLSLLTVFLQDFGQRLGRLINNDAITALINGDQDDGSQAAATIGIDNPVTGLLYKDFLHAWVRGSQLGRMYDAMVAGEAMSETILELKEFKEKQAGAPLKNVRINQVLPSMSDVYVSTQVPNNQVILVDPRMALVQLTAIPLLVEGEKIIQKQIEQSFASIMTGFANIYRDARVIVDRSIALAGNDFPAWMDSDL